MLRRNLLSTNIDDSWSSTISSKSDGLEDLDRGEVGFQPSRCSRLRSCQAWMSCWAKWNMAFADPAMEERFLGQHYNTKRFYIFFLVAGLFLCSVWAACIALVSSATDTPISGEEHFDSSAEEKVHNSMDLVIVLLAVALATLNLAFPASRPYWWLVCFLVLIAEIEDTIFSASDDSMGETTRHILQMLDNTSSLLSSSSFTFGEYVYEPTAPGSASPALEVCNVSLQNLTQIIFYSGTSTALGYMGRLASFWAYPAVILILQQPSRHALLALIVPFVFAIVNVLPAFAPQGSIMNIDAVLTPSGHANGTCYPDMLVPVWRYIATYSCFVAVVFAAVVLVSVRAEQALRKVFLLEDRLQQKISRVLRNANPFNPSDLQRWLNQMEQQTRRLKRANRALAVNDGNNALARAGNSGDFVSGSASTALASASANAITVADGGASAAARAPWELDPSELELVTRIAAGSAAMVWQATYAGFPVAAKQFYGLIESSHEESVRELAVEARVLSRLHHVNVLSFIGLCYHRDQDTSLSSVMMVTELCVATLRDYIEGNPSAVAERRIPKRSLASGVQIVSEIASGLMYLHVEHGIIHRDLKPENVMFSEQGRVRIGDFGLSAFALTESEAHHVVGTPAYMAPELLQHLVGTLRDSNSVNTGTGAIEPRVDEIPSLKTASTDERAFSSASGSAIETNTTNSQLDVYAFAIICWEVLAQRSIGYKAVRDEAELAEEVVNGKRPPLDAVAECYTKLGQELSPVEASVISALSQLIETMWVSGPDARPRFEDIVPALASIERKLNRARKQTRNKSRGPSSRGIAFQSMSFTRSGSAPHLRRESFDEGAVADRFMMPSSLLSSSPPESLVQSDRWKRNAHRNHEDLVCWNLPPNFFGERARSMSSSSALLSSTGTTLQTGSFSSSRNDSLQRVSSRASTELSVEIDSTQFQSKTKVSRPIYRHTQAVGAVITRFWVAMWTRCGLIFPDASYETTFLKHHYFTPRYFRALLVVGIIACLLYIALAAMLIYSTSPAGLIVYPWLQSVLNGDVPKGFFAASGAVPGANDVAGALTFVLFVFVTVSSRFNRMRDRWVWIAAPVIFYQVSTFICLFFGIAHLQDIYRLVRQVLEVPLPNAPTYLLPLSNATYIKGILQSSYSFTDEANPQGVCLGHKLTASSSSTADAAAAVHLNEVFKVWFSYGAFVGAEAVFIRVMVLVALPLLLLALSLPIRVYMCTLFLPLGEVIYFLEVENVFLYLDLDIQALDPNCSSLILAGPQSNTAADGTATQIKFLLIVCGMYVLVPVFCLMSEVQARRLFHVQNVVAGRFRELDSRVPPWLRDKGEFDNPSQSIARVRHIVEAAQHSSSAHHREVDKVATTIVSAEEAID